MYYVFARVAVHDEEVIVSFSLPEYTLTEANDGMAFILGCCLSIPLTSNKGRVRVDGAIRYLAACETLRPLGIIVHKLLHVLICLACKSCIFPSDMPGHLKEHGFYSRFLIQVTVRPGFGLHF
jgi:hypothetical protein